MEKPKKLRGSKIRKPFTKNVLCKKETNEDDQADKKTTFENVWEQEPHREVVIAVHPALNYNTSQSTMQSHNTDSFGLCCCCLELPCPKNMWTEYSWMGHAEIYGDMIIECFGLTFPEELKSKQQICEVCVTRLRDSLRFRRQVALCHSKLVSLANNTDATQIKVETPEDDNNITNYEDYSLKGNETKSETEIDSKNVTLASDDPEQNAQLDDVDHHSDTADVPNLEEKLSKDKPIEKSYKLNRTTVRKDRRTGPRTDHVRPRENIGRLLQHTTILPFKSNKGYFNCFYCNKQFVVIEELRGHVQETHQDITLMSIIKNILRPHDRIKADISRITCKICSKPAANMHEIVKHLEEHSVKFNYEDKLLKPTDCLLAYDLSDGKFTCVVCRAEFHFFKTLTKHMNEHSTNYVCDVCGKCFLLSERLKAHTQVHISNAAVHCDLCGKVCATMGRLRSHKRHHHKKRSHVCGICNESFPTFRQRMQHLEEKHHRSPLNLSCKICFKSFKTTSHLGCHMRTEHYNIPYIRKRKKKNDEKSVCHKVIC